MAFLTRLKGYRTRHAIRFISAGLARFHIRWIAAKVEEASRGWNSRCRAWRIGAYFGARKTQLEELSARIADAEAEINNRMSLLQKCGNGLVSSRWR